MPGWAGSNRQHELPADWPARRKAALDRDGWRCQHIRFDTGEKCGRFANECDHIIRPEAGGTDDLSNLEALCHYHHLQKSGHEGGTAAQAKRRRRTEAAEHRHPGLLA